MLFPPGHPYHISVIGTHEDLEAATVADVKDFFATYYIANNASLCVAGDFDPAKIKPLVAQLFGTIPRGNEPPHKTAAPVKLDGTKRATMLDKVQLPAVIFAYHSPPAYADGDAEMSLTAALLTQGKTSRLYKRLVYDDKIATEIRAYQDSQQLGSVFRIDVLANPDADLDRIEKTVDEELGRLTEKGIGAEELEQRKATIELAMLERLQGVQAKADQLNEYEYFWGEPNSFKRDLDRYRTATAEKVQRWAGQVLTPNGRVIMRVLPESPERGPTPRDTRPAPLPVAAFKPQAPESFHLANGVPVMLWSRKDLPLVEMTVQFRTGGILSDNTHAGLVYLTASMLDEGAGELNALQFGDRMQSLGAEFSTAADHESIGGTLKVLKRKLEPAASLVADALRRPRFDPPEWDRVRKLHLEDLKQQEDEPAIVAERIAVQAFFGDSHPYARPVVGVPETVEKLALDDVKAQYRFLVRPETLTIFIAGDITTADAKPSLDRLFGDWKAEGTVEPKAVDVPVPAREEMRVVVVNRPDAVQTVIRFVLPGPKYTDNQRVAYRLINTILGGSFTSRLNMNLREAHGYTYGAKSHLVMGPRVGYLTTGSSVRTEVTGAALNEFIKELKGISGNPITDAEAVKAREMLRTEVVQSFADLGGILSEAEERLGAGLPFDSLETDLAAMQNASAQDLNTVAGSAVPLNRGVLVLVGDKAKILDQIKDLRLPSPIEMTAGGERVGSASDH